MENWFRSDVARSRKGEETSATSGVGAVAGEPCARGLNDFDSVEHVFEVVFVVMSKDGGTNFSAFDPFGELFGVVPRWARTFAEDTGGWMGERET